jgi:hypothetical protein
MLDLLIAATEAAHTEERRMMLDGILDNQDRDLQRALESGVDHGDLLDDDFFWCFMGLAGLHAGRAAWRTLMDYGYNLDTEITPPPDAEGDGLGRAAKGTPLGCWMAQIAPTDRLTFLQEQGWLKPWKPAFDVADKRLSAGEMGMLTGSAEHFDYWFPQWKQHLESEWAERLRRRSDPALPLSVTVPTVAGVLLGMDSWSQRSSSESPQQYPDHWPTAAEVRRRTDAVLIAWRNLHYPAVSEEKQFLAMCKRPPQTWSRQERGVLEGVVRWQLARIEAPFNHPIEIQALEQEAYAWLEALLKNGAPLIRGSSQDPTRLAKGLAVQHALASNGKDSPVREAVLFVERARKEAPEALEAFLTAPVSKPRTRGAGQPAIFLALADQKWTSVEQLLEWGAPTGLADAKGKLLGAHLMAAFLAFCDDQDSARPTFQNLKTWMGKASAEEKEALMALTDKHVVSDQFDRQKRYDLPEFVLLERGHEKMLAWMIEQGLPIDRRSAEGMALGWAILQQAGENKRLEPKLWQAFRSKALATGDKQIPDTYLNRDLDSLVNEFKQNPGLALTTLKACWLDSRWEAGNAPTSRSRPRM